MKPPYIRASDLFDLFVQQFVDSEQLQLAEIWRSNDADREWLDREFEPLGTIQTRTQGGGSD